MLHATRDELPKLFEGKVAKWITPGGAQAMVEDGLKAGERVVVYPSDALRDGSRLEVVRAPRR